MGAHGVISGVWSRASYEHLRPSHQRDMSGRVWEQATKGGERKAFGFHGCALRAWVVCRMKIYAAVVRFLLQSPIIPSLNVTNYHPIGQLLTVPTGSCVGGPRRYAPTGQALIHAAEEASRQQGGGSQDSNAGQG